MFNYNNNNQYGQNQMSRYNTQGVYGQVPQPTIQQPMATYTPQPVAPVVQGLQGKLVDSIDVVKGAEIPLDGSISYFPLTDGSAIVTKQLQMDGTAKTIIYKPFEENKAENKEVNNNEEITNQIKMINKDNENLIIKINNMQEQINELSNNFKEFLNEVTSNTNTSVVKGGKK